jgi:hypothetical protein
MKKVSTRAPQGTFDRGEPQERRSAGCADASHGRTIALIDLVYGAFLSV